MFGIAKPVTFGSLRRTPSTTAAFVWMAVLALALLGPAALAVAQPADDAADNDDATATVEAPPTPEGIRGARYPALSPDGSLLTFTYGGDIWIMPAEGGEARRITRHDSYDVCARFSPDGTTLAFSSNRDGGYNVFTVSVEGGIPERLTQDFGNDYFSDWLDNDTVLVTSFRDSAYHVYAVPTDFSTPRRLTRMRGMDPAITPDGRWMFVVEGSIDPLQRRYSGSGNYDLYRVDLTSPDRLPERFTHTLNNEFDPLAVEHADGLWIYFRAERDGTYNLFRKRADAAVDVEAEPVTTYNSAGLIDALNYNAATNSITFEYDFYVYRVTLEEGFPVEPIAVKILEDETGDTSRTRTLTDGAMSPDVSADGTSLAFELNGDIWVMPAGGGQAQRVTSGPAAEEWPRFSPNGRYLGYQTTVDGASEIMALDRQTGQTLNLSRNAGNDYFFSWAPDMSSIVFCSDRGGEKDIWLQNVQDLSQPAVQLTTARGPDDDPCFSPDGTQIVFDSGRTGQQDIWIMSADGSNQRPLSQSGAFDQVAQFSSDGRFVVFESYAELGPGQLPALYIVSASGGPRMMVVSRGNGATYTPDSREIVYTVPGGRHSGSTLARIPAPTEIVTGTSIPLFATVGVTRQEDWAGIFDEAWTALGNAFYDAAYHGQDWNQLRARYRPLVLACTAREEVILLMNKLVGELGASHQGVYGSTAYAQAPGQNGQLGCEFEVVQTGRGTALEITSILPDSPADLAWLRVGDHIFGVNGTRLQAGVNFYALMRGTAGRAVQLLVSPGSDFDHGRPVTVTPTDWSSLRNQQHQRDLRRSAERTHERSGGRVAYTHIPAMNQQSLQAFQQFVVAHFDSAEGLVIDIRGNGGGNIHRELMDILIRTRFAYTTARGGPRFYQPSVVWDKPVSVIVDRTSFSDAEVFPSVFQASERGVVVGQPTSGSVIGTFDSTLSDGLTRVRLPSTGYFLMDDTNMEGTGCTPDIIVEITPDDVINERDPQLDAAIDAVLAELDGIASGDDADASGGTGSSDDNGEGDGQVPPDDSDESSFATPRPNHDQELAPNELPYDYEWQRWFVPCG